MKRLGSPRLAMALFLLLAGLSSLGTFIPQGRAQGEYALMMGNNLARVVRALSLNDLYHSAWYRFLLLGLMVNMIICITLRFPVILSSLRGEAALQRKSAFETDNSTTTEDRLKAVLIDQGFRERAGESGRIFSRGGIGHIFTIASHISLLVIMAFSFAGSSLGFTGTQRVFVGQSTDTYYNWKVQRDLPLPFRMAVEDFQILPYPTAVKLGVLRIANGEKGKELTTHEGRVFSVPGIPGKVKLVSFDIQEKTYKALWLAPGGETIPFVTGDEIGSSGVSLVVTAFAFFPEKEVFARTVLLDGERVLVRADIAVNHPISIQGLDIYLTDYGRDKFGFPFVGYQIVSDPGKPGVWAGSILFLLSVTGAIFIRPRCVVIRRQAGRLLVHMSGRGHGMEKEQELIMAFTEALNEEAS